MSALETADWQAELSQLCAAHRVPGAQLAVRTGGSTVAVEHGVRSTAGGGPVTRDTAFPVGSVTKPFTAALAMALVDDGDLGLDDPLEGVCEEFGAGRVVSLRQLLSHTSGMAAYVADEEAERAEGTLRWMRGHTGEQSLTHEPGTAFSYSNAGFAVVGGLVESVTGLDWREAVSVIVLAPLGITPAFARGRAPAGSSHRPVADGHTVRRDRERIACVREQALHAVEDPNGGLALSAADLLDFAGLFMPGPASETGVLSSAATAEMCRDQLVGVGIGPFGMADGWGLGLARHRDAAGADFYGHDGTLDGVSCHLRFAPDGGTAVALTANANTGEDVWAALVVRLEALGLPVGDHSHSRRCGGELTGPGTPLRPVPAGAGRLPPECLTGRYVNGAAQFTVERDGDGLLLLSSGGGPAYVLDCDANLTFTMRSQNGESGVFTGRFVPGADSGPAECIQLSGRLAWRT